MLWEERNPILLSLCFCSKVRCGVCSEERKLTRAKGEASGPHARARTSAFLPQDLPWPSTARRPPVRPLLWEQHGPPASPTACLSSPRALAPAPDPWFQEDTWSDSVLRLCFPRWVPSTTPHYLGCSDGTRPSTLSPWISTLNLPCRSGSGVTGPRTKTMGAFLYSSLKDLF